MYTEREQISSAVQAECMYPQILIKEINELDKNDVSICDDRAMQYIEAKLNNRLNHTAPAPVTSYVFPLEMSGGRSQIVVYSISLEEVFEKFGSVEALWSLVESEFLSQKDVFAALVMHEDKLFPHIHLLLRFPDKEELSVVARILGETYLNKKGESCVCTAKLDYLLDNLYEVFQTLMRVNDVHCEENDALIIHICPELAQFLVMYEFVRNYVLYKTFNN